MARSPYLKPNRLADIIAAIQFMAMHERSSLAPEDWAEGISGDSMKAIQWKTVFCDHPEFFRPSPNNQGYYALVWRRALPRLYFRRESRMVTPAEYAAMSAEDRKLVSRPPVPEEQVKTMIGLAIELHEDARRQHTDWRWWVPIVASFLGSLVAVLLGLAFGKGVG
jgi:hypothetical protein